MKYSFPICRNPVPAITTAEMVEVDRLMMEEYGIRLSQMMELAGRNLADLTEILIDDKTVPICVCAGTGNNGGGGMTAARHLANRGYLVSAYLIGDSARLKPVPAERWQTLRRMKNVTCLPSLPEEDVLSRSFLLDAVIGYGLQGPVRGSVAKYLPRVKSGRPAFILALDAPTGLDTTAGAITGNVISAQATLTLALPKKGLLTPPARVKTGQLFLADIGVPDDILTAIGHSCPSLFAPGPILRLP
ncbi:MAG: NAD(P)H-hydrate epimerase [Fidelibacterota bacterium]